MLEEHWGPVVSERHVDRNLPNDHLGYAVRAPDNFQWDIPLQIVREAIVRTTESTPGPDGVPYSAWRVVAGEVAPLVHRALVALAGEVEELPEEANLSSMVFLPKAPPLGDIEVFTSDLSALRPLTLTDTLPKVLALAANDRLSALAAVIVLGQQRGVVPGRRISHNLYEL